MRNLLHTKRGSNQYSTEFRVLGLRDKTWLDIFWIVLFIFFASQVFMALANSQRPLISPIAMNAYADYEADSELVIDTPEKQRIAAYIKQVFGKDADKAFKVLSCENASLNPRAVNTAGNTPVGSRDTGVFQINEYWQKVQYKFLLNYKVNIEIAYQIYTENGKTFERWTCGRKFGI